MSDIDDERIRRLDGSLLLVLRELLRQRRTTLAAAQLGLSQSAVSHALGRLRALFDDPLFVRLPHGLEPTPRALALGPRVEHLLASMSDVLGIDDRFDPSVARHSFRLCAPDHVATLLAPALTRELTTRAPHARFSFDQVLGDDAIDALHRHETDIALGRFRRRVPREFVTEQLYADEYCLIARDGHPGVHGAVSLADYGALDHVVTSVTGDFRSLDIEPGRERARPGRVIAAVPRFSMTFPVVAGSDAVAIAPRRLAESLGPVFGVRVHDLPMRTEPIEVLLVHRREPPAATQWLAECLRATATEAR